MVRKLKRSQAVKEKYTYSFGEMAISELGQNNFLEMVKKLINWQRLEELFESTLVRVPKGASSYSPILMLKILLLQQWYNLSDPQAEEQIQDRISFIRFLGLSLDSPRPDHSSISRFRKYLLEQEVYERVFLEVNSQLNSYNLNVKNGSVIDATVVSSSRRPRKVLEVKEVAEDRKEEENAEQISVSYSSDIDAKWLKKGHKYYYGYKVHASCSKNGYFQGCTVTGANESDTRNFPGLLDKLALAEGQEVLADKGYDSEANDTKVKEMKLKNRIMKKAVKNKPLTEEDIRVNKLISKERYIIEQNFGGVKKHQGFDRMRYMGVSKCLLESYLKMLSFNIKKGANEFLKFTIIPTDLVFNPIF